MKDYKSMIHIGDKFNNLTVVDIYKDRCTTCYKCICDCGNERIVDEAYKLVNGRVKTCGCSMNLKSVKTNADRRLVDIWRQMHRRCEMPTHINYKSYGAKGIAVCDEWKDKNSFISWAYNNGYNNSLTLDRIDSSKGYSPDNCRWVDHFVQNNNSSHCHMLEYKGEKKSMSEWAKNLSIPYSTIKTRINKLHWSTEEAFETPYFHSR